MDDTAKEEAQRRGISSCSTNSSPEFEFWVTRNPSQPDHLLSADELFVDGVLLPLHLLTTNHIPPQPINCSSTPLQPDPVPAPETSLSSSSSISATTTLTASKRWKDILFNKSTQHVGKEKPDKDRDKEINKVKKKRQGGSSSSAELNINIWPFSRSRSAGNGATRPKLFPAGSTREVNSAPCSRSNSAGESKSRKWPSSPGRVSGGFYVGRSSPVWQVRRGARGYSEAGVRSCDKAAGGSKKASNGDGDNDGISKSNIVGTNKVKLLNMNVPRCIGYRHHLSCTRDENVGSGGSSRGKNDVGSGGGHGLNGGGANTTIGHGNGYGAPNLFNLRSLFTKKVH